MRKLSLLVASLGVYFFCHDASALSAEARAITFCTAVNNTDTACRDGWYVTYHKGNSATLYKRTDTTCENPGNADWASCEVWSPIDVTYYNDVQAVSSSCCFVKTSAETITGGGFIFYNTVADPLPLPALPVGWTQWGAGEIDSIVTWTEGSSVNYCTTTDTVYQGIEFEDVDDHNYTSDMGVMACKMTVVNTSGSYKTMGIEYRMDE